MGCIDNIVTVKGCNTSPPTSGFDLFDAPEISIRNANSTANETYVQGFAMLQNKLRLAIIQVRNDFIAALNGNNIATKISEVAYPTGTFNASVNNGLYAGERGIILYRNPAIRGKLRKIKITQVQLYPLASGSFNLKIYDTINGVWSYTAYPVTLIANQVNTLPINYQMQGAYASILIDNTALPMASSYLTCMTGCGGTMPNDCGYVMGYNGVAQVKSEGYGINATFSCSCDYEQILCDLSQTYIGELIWLKARYNVVEEQFKTNRFNNLIIYSHDDLPAIMQGLDAEYTGKWNSLMQGLYNILNTYRDSCLSCRGVTFRTNL